MKRENLPRVIEINDAIRTAEEILYFLDTEFLVVGISSPHSEVLAIGTHDGEISPLKPLAVSFKESVVAHFKDHIQKLTTELEAL